MDNKSLTEIIISFTIILSVILYYNFEGKNNIIDEFAHHDTYYPPPRGGGGGCIGSTTLLNTLRGKITLQNVKVGDEIMSLDENNNLRYQTVFYKRTHGCELINHYKIILKTFNGRHDVVTLSPDHLVVLLDNSYKRADKLRTRDKLKNSFNQYSTIINITLIKDIPITPVVLSGKICLLNNTIVSCWSGDKENVEKMTILMDLTRPYTKKYSPEEVSVMMHNVYEKFNEKKKDTENLEDILKSLNLPLLTE